MKNSLAFVLWTSIVLFVAGLIVFFYGLPMLKESTEQCHYGGGTRTFGCTSSFGNLMTLLFIGVGLALGGIWSRFGRY